MEVLSTQLLLPFILYDPGCDEQWSAFANTHWGEQRAVIGEAVRLSQEKREQTLSLNNNLASLFLRDAAEHLSEKNCLFDAAALRSMVKATHINLHINFVYAAACSSTWKWPNGAGDRESSVALYVIQHSTGEGFRPIRNLSGNNDQNDTNFHCGFTPAVQFTEFTWRCPPPTRQKHTRIQRTMTIDNHCQPMTLNQLANRATGELHQHPEQLKWKVSGPPPD